MAKQARNKEAFSANIAKQQFQQQFSANIAKHQSQINTCCNEVKMQMKQAVPMPIVNWSADGQQFQQQPERKMHTYILERWTSSINKEVFQQPWKSEWQKGGMDWL